MHIHTHTYTHHHHHFHHRFSTIFLTSSTVRSRSIIVSSLYLSPCIPLRRRRRRRVLHLVKDAEETAEKWLDGLFFVAMCTLMIEICLPWNNQQVALFQTNLHHRLAPFVYISTERMLPKRLSPYTLKWREDKKWMVVSGNINTSIHHSSIRRVLSLSLVSCLRKQCWWPSFAFLISQSLNSIIFDTSLN